MDFEELISYSLRVCLLVSVLLIAIGIALVFTNNGGAQFNITQIASGTNEVNSSQFSFSQILQSASGLDGIGFIFLGLIVLIGTPVIRVILSVFYFAFERNWLYTVITLIVLLNLLIAIFIVPKLVV